jgi:hypothetical protein
MTIQHEIIEAKKTIESELQTECRAFASPFNRFSPEIALLAAQSHDFVRFGPHIPDVLTRLRPIWPVYNSSSLLYEVLLRTLREGFSFLSHVAVKGAVILQLHGFDGEGWEPLPFNAFEDFVEAYIDMLSGDDMLTFFSKKDSSNAADTVH